MGTLLHATSDSTKQSLGSTVIADQIKKQKSASVVAEFFAQGDRATGNINTPIRRLLCTSDGVAEIMTLLDIAHYFEHICLRCEHYLITDFTKKVLV